MKENCIPLLLLYNLKAHLVGINQICTVYINSLNMDAYAEYVQWMLIMSSQWTFRIKWGYIFLYLIWIQNC
jgi:hypothetical protein